MVVPDDDDAFLVVTRQAFLPSPYKEDGKTCRVSIPTSTAWMIASTAYTSFPVEMGRDKK